MSSEQIYVSTEKKIVDNFFLLSNLTTSLFPIFSLNTAKSSVLMTCNYTVWKFACFRVLYEAMRPYSICWSQRIRHLLDFDLISSGLVWNGAINFQGQIIILMQDRIIYNI